MTGWMLARAGIRVAVIDAGAPATTNAAAGMLAPSFEKTLHKSGDALVNFSEESLRRWPATAELLAERSGVSIDFDQSGVLSVAFDERDAAIFDADNEGGERLTRKETLELEPALASNVVGARFARNDGQVDPRLALKALAAAFAADGGELRRGKRVAEISSENGKVSGVYLHDGEKLAAEAVIVATGARLLGLSNLPAGAAFPVKGEALSIAKSDGAPRRVVRTSRAYLCPKADGRIVIGATEISGDWTLTADEARIAQLRAGADAAFPALAASAEIERWAGLRPATRDGAPIIGPAPDGPEGLIYALGHYRNGVLLAPATAHALAELVEKGRLSPSIAAFSAARFKGLGVS